MIRYYWAWICDICGREVKAEQEYNYQDGDLVAKAPYNPDGYWRTYADRLVCDRHKVTIEDA